MSTEQITVAEQSSELICLACAAGDHGMFEGVGFNICDCLCHGVPAERAFHSCDECGEQFRGGTAATDWINHTVPTCKRQELRRELAQHVASRDRLEKAIREALETAIDGDVPYYAVIEMVARTIEAQANREPRNAEEWEQRAAVIFEAANFGEAL